MIIEPNNDRNNNFVSIYISIKMILSNILKLIKWKTSVNWKYAIANNHKHWFKVTNILIYHNSLFEFQNTFSSWIATKNGKKNL